MEYHSGRIIVQYICLVGRKIQPLDGYVAACAVLTIEVYDLGIGRLEDVVGKDA